MKFTQRQLARSATSLFSKQTNKPGRSQVWRIPGVRNISSAAVQQRGLDEDPIVDMAKGPKFDLKVPKGTKDCRRLSPLFWDFRFPEYHTWRT